MKINIAIDGPSGAGKSTIADELAKRLNYVHLDTGAMYRAVGYLTLKNNIAIDDEEAIVEMMNNNFNLEMKTDGSVILNGENLGDKIRTPEMSMAASDVSKLLGVRKALVKAQQKIASQKGYIVDGRDICEVVLPDAEVKIFLTASAENRAERRVLQNKEKGIDCDYNTILEDIKKRDYQDSHRENSPLHQTADATLIDSSDLSIEEVTNKILDIVKEKTA